MEELTLEEVEVFRVCLCFRLKAAECQQKHEMNYFFVLIYRVEPQSKQ